MTVKQWTTPEGKTLTYEETVHFQCAHPGGGEIRLISSKWAKDTKVNVEIVSYDLDVDDLQPTDVRKKIIKFGTIPNSESVEPLVSKARDFIYDHFGE